MIKIVSRHEDIVAAWIETSPKDLIIPPPCFIHMEGKFVCWNPQKKLLSARFPIKAEFQNPRKYMQGGFVVAALDNTLGPLSYLSGVPSVTVQLNTSYIRPTAPSYEYIEVTASIIDQTSSKIYSTAEARSPEGKLLSIAHATSHIVI